MYSMENESPLSRRTVLKGTVAGALGSSAFSGLASATGNSQGQSQSCSCPSGTRLVAKFENEDGELVFEKTDTEMSPSDNFSFSNISYKEDDPEEIMSLEWDSFPYTVTEVVIKTGDGCFDSESDAVSIDSEEPGSGSIDVSEIGKKALSNIHFCAPAFFQLDAANTESPYEIGNPTRTYEGIAGGGEYGCVGYRLTAGGRINEDFSSYSTIEPNDDCTEAELTLVPKRVPPEADGNVSVISADAPAFLPKSGNSDYREAIIDEQVIFDEDARKYTESDVGTEFTHTVSIPQPQPDS